MANLDSRIRAGLKTARDDHEAMAVIRRELLAAGQPAPDDVVASILVAFRGGDRIPLPS